MSTSKEVEYDSYLWQCYLNVRSAGGSILERLPYTTIFSDIRNQFNLHFGINHSDGEVWNRLSALDNSGKRKKAYRLKRNAFEALSFLAFKEHWCHQIHCTTCGHMVFRCGLKAIALGRHPEDKDWPVHFNKRQGKRKTETLDELFRTATSLNSSEQRNLQVLASSDLVLQNLVDGVESWRWHIGLLLCYTEEAENTDLILTRSLLPQLITIDERSGDSVSKLSEILNSGRALNWRDL